MFQLDEILWNDWNPIGINEVAPRDEYQSYTPAIFRLKISGRDKETITKKLYEIETVNIGLSGNIDNCQQVADKIIALQ